MKVEQLADIEIDRLIERTRSEILELDRAIMLTPDIQNQADQAARRQKLEQLITELEGRKSG